MLPVLGAVWLQTGIIDSGAILLCVPVSCWVVAILIINEVPDAAADRAARKRTLVVRFGDPGARRIYFALTLTALAASGAAIALRALPAWYAIPAVAFAVLGMIALLGISSYRSARARLKRSIELTLAVQGVGCITLVVALLSRRFI